MVVTLQYTRRHKHIDIRFHAIKQLKQECIIDFKYCPTEFMTADTLTKYNPKREFGKHRTNLNLLPYRTHEITGKCRKNRSDNLI